MSARAPTPTRAHTPDRAGGPPLSLPRVLFSAAQPHAGVRLAGWRIAKRRPASATSACHPAPRAGCAAAGSTPTDALVAVASRALAWRAAAAAAGKTIAVRSRRGRARAPLACSGACVCVPTRATCGCGGWDAGSDSVEWDSRCGRRARARVRIAGKIHISIPDGRSVFRCTALIPEALTRRPGCKARPTRN